MDGALLRKSAHHLLFGKEISLEDREGAVLVAYDRILAAGCNSETALLIVQKLKDRILDWAANPARSPGAIGLIYTNKGLAYVWFETTAEMYDVETMQPARIDTLPEVQLTIFLGPLWSRLKSDYKVIGRIGAEHSEAEASEAD